MKTKAISIRQSFLRSFALLILVTSGAILAVTIIAGKNSAEDFSRSLILKAARQTRAELKHFFGSVHKQVLIGREWAKAGILDPTDYKTLNDLFQPVLANNPHLSSMMVASSNGIGYLLLHDAFETAKWMNRITYPQNVALMRYWNTAMGKTTAEKIKMDYDVRKRIWYQGSLETEAGNPEKEIHWTKPVIFYITKDPGITAGAHIKLANGQVLVVAFDLLLLDVARLTSKRIRPSENGTAFVLVEDGDSLRVVGLPRSEKYADDKALKEELFIKPDAAADSSAQLPKADEFEVGPVSRAVKAWRQTGRQADTTFAFSSPGGDWWAQLQPFHLGRNRFWIAVAVPESDFLQEADRQRNIVILISILALAGAAFWAAWLARRYSRPLEALMSTSQRIRVLDLDAEPPRPTNLREINALADSQRELISAMQSFVRYVPLEVVRELVKQGDVAQIGGSTVRLTILFTDIEGFTSISEALSPQKLAEHMADYFDTMLGELQSRGTTVDKFVGDAIVAFWGAPRPDKEHARHAVESTLACLEKLQIKNAEWQEHGVPSMKTRFGLATGEVVVGNIGAQSRLSYTVLGDKVNLAARLEGLNKIYGTDILAEEAAVAAAGDGYLWRKVDKVAVKGKTEAVAVFELLGRKGEVPAERLEFAAAYEELLELFQTRRFKAAEAKAHKLLEQYPADVSLVRLSENCRAYALEPPPADWDGVTKLQTK